MIVQPHFVKTLQYNCVAKKEIITKTTVYKKYHFLLTKIGKSIKLLIYTITIRMDKYCRKGFSDQ